MSNLALVEKRNNEQNKAEDKERNDAVEAFQIRAVIQKDFDDHQAEENESLPAQQCGFASDPKSDQRGSVGGQRRESARCWARPESIPKPA